MYVHKPQFTSSSIILFLYILNVPVLRFLCYIWRSTVKSKTLFEAVDTTVRIYCRACVEVQHRLNGTYENKARCYGCIPPSSQTPDHRHHGLIVFLTVDLFRHTGTCVAWTKYESWAEIHQYKKASHESVESAI